jgi:hypothetical protein
MKFTKLIPILLIAVALLAVSVSAQSSQGNVVQVSGSGNDVTQSNSMVFTDHSTNAETYNDPSSTAISTNNYYNIQGSPVQELAKNDIVFDRIIMANQVLEISVADNNLANQTVLVMSGTPVAVYAIGSLDQYKVFGKESELVYDAPYDRMDTGDVQPIAEVPYYTSDCRFRVPADAAYLVIDNRYYANDAEIQIGIPGTTTEI